MSFSQSAAATVRSENEYEQRLFTAMRKIGRYTAAAFSVVGLIVVVVAATIGMSTNWQVAGSYFGASLLYGAASAGLGAAIGFIFGIPRSVQAEGPTATVIEGLGERTVRSNTNLERISDWLTGMLVGIGLISIPYIAETFKSIGEKAALGFPGIPFIGMTAQLIVVYGLIAGFLSAYLVTRILVPTLIENAEGLLNLRGFFLSGLNLTEEESRRLSRAAGETLKTGQASGDLGNQTVAEKVAAQPLEGGVISVESLQAAANASAILSDYNRAADLYKRALAKQPENKELGVKATFALQRAGRNEEAIALAGQLTSKSPNVDIDLELTRIYAELYGGEKGIAHAIKRGEELKPLLSGPKLGQLMFYLASAYGQKWRRLPDAPESQPERDELRQKTLDAVRTSLALDDRWRINLKMLWDPNFPNKNKKENDLEQFIDDPKFIELLGPKFPPKR